MVEMFHGSGKAGFQTSEERRRWSLSRRIWTLGDEHGAEMRKLKRSRWEGKEGGQCHQGDCPACSPGSPDLEDTDNRWKGGSKPRMNSKKSTTLSCLSSSKAQSWDLWRVLGTTERARTMAGLPHALKQSAWLWRRAWRIGPSSFFTPVISMKHKTCTWDRVRIKRKIWRLKWWSDSERISRGECLSPCFRNDGRSLGECISWSLISPFLLGQKA